MTQYMVRGTYRRSLRVGGNTQQVYPCHVLLIEKIDIRWLGCFVPNTEIYIYIWIV